MPNGRPLILQGSIRNHMLKHRLSKKRLVSDILDYLFIVKQAPMVLVPAFTFSVFESLTYQQDKAPEMGYISEHVFKYCDFDRTRHPMYSFFIIQEKKAKSLKYESYDDSIRCFGHGSFFDFMEKNQGLQVCLNLFDAKCMTYYHHVEKQIGATHRFEKIFEVTNPSEKTLKNIHVYVRKSGIQTDVSGIEKMMWNENIWNGIRPSANEPSERWCDLSECLSLVSKVGANNLEGLLFNKLT